MFNRIHPDYKKGGQKELNIVNNRYLHRYNTILNVLKDYGASKYEKFNIYKSFKVYTIGVLNLIQKCYFNVKTYFFNIVGDEQLNPTYAFGLRIVDIM